MCFWGGLMRIAERSGLTDVLAKGFSFILGGLFRDIDKNGRAFHAICMNITANLLGLGNAATPFGIEAMKALAEEEKAGDTATPSMVIFTVLNTASITLIPSTALSIRMKYGSAEPLEIIPAVWITSAAALAFSLTAAVLPFIRRKMKGEPSMTSLVIPICAAIVILWGIYKRTDIFGEFVKGAADNLKTCAELLPTLIALITAVGMFKASGAMELITNVSAQIFDSIGFPSQCLPLALIRPVSGSGALAVYESIISDSGPDSFAGKVASVMLGSTETTFYTLAVYYGAAGIKRTRHTLAASLTGDLTGFIFSVLTVNLLLR